VNELCAQFDRDTGKGAICIDTPADAVTRFQDGYGFPGVV
jgi:hypothetical protein